MLTPTTNSSSQICQPDYDCTLLTSAWTDQTKVLCQYILQPKDYTPTYSAGEPLTFRSSLVHNPLHEQRFAFTTLFTHCICVPKTHMRRSPACTCAPDTSIATLHAACVQLPLCMTGSPACTNVYSRLLTCMMSSFHVCCMPSPMHTKLDGLDYLKRSFPTLMVLLF